MNPLFLLPLIILLIVLPSLAFGMNAIQAYSILRDERTLSNAADSVMKHAASAELHGNMTAHNMYIVQNNVLVCIINTMFHNDTMNASACDQTIAGNIANHDLGNNQTIIDLAKQYLALRGIQ